MRTTPRLCRPFRTVVHGLVFFAALAFAAGWACAQQSAGRGSSARQDKASSTSGPASNPASSGRPATLKVGFAERDITPEIGMERPGGYGKVFHKRLHDPCKVRAAVFDDGTTCVALVGVDALLVRRPLVEAVRRQIHQRCGLAPEAILIGASHSHSSGPTGMILPGEYDHASEFVQKLAYEKSSCADPKYLRLVERQLVDAVCAAYEGRVAGKVGFGFGRAEGVAFNRRFLMKNGLTYTHPRQGNPDIVRVAGPTDPQVGVVGGWSEDGRLLGCVVNFACHATTSPPGISANYIYYLEKVIRGLFGSDVVVVFLAGACGDVTQVDNLSPYRFPSGEKWAQIVGGTVGAEAVKVLVKMYPDQVGPLAYKTKLLKIRRRAPSPERVKRCYELVQKSPSEVGSTEWTFAKEIVLLDAKLKREPVANVEVQAIQIGPAVFLANPAEFFCQLGLDIKAGSPFPFTFPVELANGCVGYVPTEDAFGPHGGGYETRLTSYSNLEVDAGPRIVQASLALARQLQPGPVPEPPRAPPFNGKPWSYGNVPPELE